MCIKQNYLEREIVAIWSLDSILAEQIEFAFCMT